MSVPLSQQVPLQALVPESAEEWARECPPDLLQLLYKQMRILAGPRPDLDDLVQCAAERLLRVLPRFEGRSSLATFTYGVAYRTLLGHDRWYRRWRRRFSYEEEHTNLEPPAISDDGERATVRKRRAESLHRALKTLPPEKRAVIVLHDLEGVDLKDLAAIVDANERTLRSRLRDGRKRLAELLSADPAFDPEAP